MPPIAQSFHKASGPIAQRTGRPRLFGAQTFEEGIAGDGWGDRTPGDPALYSSQDWPGPPHDAGRTHRGPSQHIGSRETRDLSSRLPIAGFDHRTTYRRRILTPRLIVPGELGEGGAPSHGSDLPAMLSRKGSEKCAVTTTTDLIEDWIQMRSTLSVN